MCVRLGESNECTVLLSVSDYIVISICSGKDEFSKAEMETHRVVREDNLEIEHSETR